jgi:DNA-binding transcriptional LysR family regulator
MTTAPQIAALHDHVIDVGLLREPPDGEGLMIEEVLSERFVAVLPAAHPLAAQRIVHVDALADEPFVIMPRAVGPTVHDRILQVCAEAGFQPRITQRAVEWQTVAALVEAGLGVSIAPASITRIRLRHVAYRRITPDGARTTAALCWRRDEREPIVQHLLETVRGLGLASVGARSGR